MNAADAVTYALLIVLAVLANMRWWRVAQREHYEPGRVLAIAQLWCRVKPINLAVFAFAVACVIAGWATTWLSAVAVAVMCVWPVGLGVRPTTSRLVFTPRLRRVAIVTVVVQVVLLALTLLLDEPGRWAAILAPLMWLPVEISLFALRPVEARLSQKFVHEAKDKLARVRPDIVAITGSYGKTSTKAYAAHLLSAARTTVASPASFNNLMGLSKAVNDRLTPGTDVFIAEMGTYGPGEIRKLASIFTPRVAAITTIGEAHLERMKNRETIVAAKSEITEGADVVVLNIDVPELDDLARALAGSKTVVRCSTVAGSDARVHVLEAGGRWTLVVDGDEVTGLPAPLGGHPINLAIAAGIVVGLDVSIDAVAARLTQLPIASNRAEVQVTADGVTIIDDTYNANPVGAAAAIRAARAAVAEGGQIFVITPGMIELGSTQVASNRALAQDATAQPGTTLVVTGLTNRTALVSGAGQQFLTFPDRTSATAAVMPQVRAGDVVVYENDLPDHYP
ncbi:Mur ligase family protein [Aeromicrobium sp. P5_D10]